MSRIYNQIQDIVLYDLVINFGNATLSDLTITDAIIFGSGATIHVGNEIYVIPDVGINASFVMTAGAQLIAGLKTFSSQVAVSATSNQLLLGTGNQILLNAPTPAGNRIYTMPDVLSSASFVMTEGVQLINGAKTFSSQVAVSAVNNQLVLGSVFNIVLNAPAPAASRLYNIPDVLANAEFVMTAGAQLIAGLKTFSSQVAVSAASNQLLLGNTTLSAPGVGPNTITFPNASGTVMLGPGPGSLAYGWAVGQSANVCLTNSDVIFDLGGTVYPNAGITTPAPGATTFTVITTGIYEFDFYVAVPNAAGTTDALQFAIYQNGAVPVVGGAQAYLFQSAIAGAAPDLMVCTGHGIISLTAGDLVTLRNLTNTANVTFTSPGFGTTTAGANRTLMLKQLA